jgi:hypothetical protein
MPVQYDSACLSRLDTSSAMVSCRQQASGGAVDGCAGALVRSDGVLLCRGLLGVGSVWGVEVVCQSVRMPPSLCLYCHSGVCCHGCNKQAWLFGAKCYAGTTAAPTGL